MGRNSYKYPDYHLYKIARDLPRGHLYFSREISKIFGYKKISKAFRKYICAVDYVHPYQLWVVRDVVGVPWEELPEGTGIVRMEHGKHPRYMIPSTIDTINRNKDPRLFLIERHKIPFWKLKEYGGYL